jgi:hypothetical protein
MNRRGSRGAGANRAVDERLPSLKKKSKLEVSAMFAANVSLTNIKQYG